MTIVNEIKNEKAIKYDVKSSKAEEFINDAEILASIEYGRENKDNIELQREFLEKARNLKGLTHREASVLLHSENEEIIAEMKQIADWMKQVMEICQKAKTEEALEEPEFKSELDKIHQEVITLSKQFKVPGLN